MKMIWAINALPATLEQVLSCLSMQTLPSRISSHGGICGNVFNDYLLDKDGTYWMYSFALADGDLVQGCRIKMTAEEIRELYSVSN
jgi:hypothetical protein